MIAPKLSSDSELIKIFEFVDLMSNTDPRYQVIFNADNQHRVSYLKSRMLKRKGLREGVPKIVIPIPSSGYHSLWVELLVKPNKLNYEQSKFIDLLILLGHCARICYSATEAIELIKEYIKGAGDGRPSHGSLGGLGSLGVNAPRAKKPRIQ